MKLRINQSVYDVELCGWLSSRESNFKEPDLVDALKGFTAVVIDVNGNEMLLYPNEYEVMD